MKKQLFGLLKNGCVIFTLLILAVYSAGSILSTTDKIFIPTLKSAWLFFGFSMLLAWANSILQNKKLNPALRLLIHYLAVGALIFSVMLLSGGFIASGFASLIIMLCYTVLYAICAAIVYAVIRSKQSKKNEGESYSSVFK